MDKGRIATHSRSAEVPVDLTLASVGSLGTGRQATPVEPDDPAGVFRDARQSGAATPHVPVDEPSGLRWCVLRGPAGNLLNVLVHTS